MVLCIGSDGIRSLIEKDQAGHSMGLDWTREGQEGGRRVRGLELRQEL